MKNVYDRISNGLKDRFDCINKAEKSRFFIFKWNICIYYKNNSIVKTCYGLLYEYKKYIDTYEFIFELNSFIQHVCSCIQLENKLINTRFHEIFNYIFLNDFKIIILLYV